MRKLVQQLGSPASLVQACRERDLIGSAFGTIDATGTSVVQNPSFFYPLMFTHQEP